MNFEDIIKKQFEGTNYSGIRYDSGYQVIWWDLKRKGFATQRIEFWTRNKIIGWKTPTIRKNYIDNDFQVNGIFVPLIEKYEEREDTYNFIARKLNYKALAVITKIVDGYEFENEPKDTLQDIVDGNYNSHDMKNGVECDDGTTIYPSQLKGAK